MPGPIFLSKQNEELRVDLAAWKEYAGRLREALEDMTKPRDHENVVGYAARVNLTAHKALGVPAPGTEEKK